jgi:peptidoglycan/xylan/chitin deacetylase (PgdA/CDA1 family)
VYDFTHDRIITRLTQFQTLPPLQQQTRSVLLTFDDGPSRNLPGILKILAAEKVPALFFWQSRLLHAKRPWRKVLSMGHMIGSHSSNHPDLTKKSYTEQYDEISRSIQKIEMLTGQRVHYFRPPFGKINETTMEVLRELQLTPMLWHISSMDWCLKDNPDQIIVNVMDHCQDGSIILLHELDQTSTVLQPLIQRLKHQGFFFVLPPCWSFSTH